MNCPLGMSFHGLTCQFAHFDSLIQAVLRTHQLPIGAGSAHGMGILTEMYVIYMVKYASHRGSLRLIY